MAEKRKTIGEHAADVLRETDNPAVMWGDCGLLDAIARRAGMPRAFKQHPYTRWQRVLNALERSPLFEKRVVLMRWGRTGNNYCRSFRLKEQSAHA